jgi:hypothetical protein
VRAATDCELNERSMDKRADTESLADNVNRHREAPSGTPPLGGTRIGCVCRNTPPDMLARNLADGRSPGLRVLAFRCLPGMQSQWLLLRKALRSQLRGQPRPRMRDHPYRVPF